MGILSFIIFLPFLFKENTMAYKEVMDDKENNTLNAIDYLKDTNKIATIYEATNADFKIIEHTVEIPDKEKKESHVKPLVTVLLFCSIYIAVASADDLIYYTSPFFSEST